MFSKSLTKHFKGFGSGFTELHAKLDGDTLLYFAILYSCKNNTCSQRGVTWQLMQKACGSVTLASPLIFFHRGSYNTNSPGTSR
jgi:hypothetical protein